FHVVLTFSLRLLFPISTLLQVRGEAGKIRPQTVVLAPRYEKIQSGSIDNLHKSSYHYSKNINSLQQRFGLKYNKSRNLIIISALSHSC
ncbi:MAG: hypothetical protein ACM67T_05985, partial [Clostridiales bacterium]